MDKWIKKDTIYIQRNKIESVEVMLMNLEPVIQREVSYKEKNIVY